MPGERVAGLGEDPHHGLTVEFLGMDQHGQTADELGDESVPHHVLGLDLEIADEQIICDDSQLAPGYGLPNQATIDAIKYLARGEGILLDPTYTGKTFAALLALLKQGSFSENDHVVFLHTGGAPSLFGYPELVEGD